MVGSNGTIRGMVWLKLPKDTSVLYFHAPVIEGGLGIPLHEHVVPLMKAKRELPDPVIAAILREASASADLAKQT